MKINQMTRGLCWVFLLMALTAFAQKGKQPKPPDVELIEASARRQEGNIMIDARVKNISEKPIKALVLLIDFIASDHKQVITTKRGSLDQEMLDPGEEAGFRAQIEDPSRATEFRINFEDGGGKYLRAEKTGPFPVE